VIDEEERQEQARLRSKQNQLHEEREAEKNELQERRFREGVDRINEHGANVVKWGTICWIFEFWPIRAITWPFLAALIRQISSVNFVDRIGSRGFTKGLSLSILITFSSYFILFMIYSYVSIVWRSKAWLTSSTTRRNKKEIILIEKGLFFASYIRD